MGDKDYPMESAHRRLLFLDFDVGLSHVLI